MKKKFICLFFILTMIVSFIPVNLKADNRVLYVAGVQVTQDNKDNVLNDGKVSFDFDTNTLTLKDETSIVCENSTDGIFVNGFDLTINCQGECFVISFSGNAIYSESGNITISSTLTEGAVLCVGSATRTAIGVYGGSIYCDNVSIYAGSESTEGYSVIYASGDILMSECEEVSIYSNISSASTRPNGIYADGGVSMKDCTDVTIENVKYGIYAQDGDVLIDDCNLNIFSIGPGIYQYYAHNSEDYSAIVKITNCEQVCIASFACGIIANGVCNSDYEYIKGGDIIINSCESVEIDAFIDYYANPGIAIGAVGGVSITKCDDVDIDGIEYGITAQFGSIVIEECEIDITARNGIYQKTYSDGDYNCDISLKKCSNVSIKALCAIFAGGLHDSDYEYVKGGNVTIEECEEVSLLATGYEVAGIYAYGGVNIADVEDFYIESYDMGISAWKGDITIDNCALAIESVGHGIEEYYIEGDCDFTNSISITNCKSVKIDSEYGNAIYAGGVWDSEDTEYIKGGDVTIDNCEEVILKTQKFDSNTIKAAGDVNILNVDEMHVESDNNGISTGYGDIVIDKCYIEIFVEGYGITCDYRVDADNAADGDISIKNSEVYIQSSYYCAIYNGGTWESDDDYEHYARGGNLLIDNCEITFKNNYYYDDYDYSGISVEGGVSITNCEVVDINAAGNGIYANYGDVVIDNCNVKIQANYSGIWQDCVYTDEDCDYTCSITITNCEELQILSGDSNALSADGVFDSDDCYVLGGKVTIDNCSLVKVSNNSEYCCIYGAGEVSITNCDEVDIDTTGCGIEVGHGDVVIDNCDVNIKANYCAIYASSLWDSEEGYVSGGNVTIDNCEEVVLDVKADSYAIYTDNDLSISNVAKLDIDSYWGGLRACGDITIDNCADIDINTVVKGIASDEDININDSNIRVVCEIPTDFEEKFEYKVTDDTYGTYGIYTEYDLIVTNSKLDITAADIGYDESDEENWGGFGSHGIYVYEDMIVRDSDITARGGKADYVSGIKVLCDLSVYGDSEINAYGNTASNKYDEHAALYSYGDIVLDGKDVVVNLHSSNNGLDKEDEDYAEYALIADWWYDDDEQVVMPTLTIKNGAQLKADAVVINRGDVIIDGGKVNVASKVGSALIVGGYEDEEDKETYFGKLIFKNNSELIATSEDESAEYAAVYVHEGVEIKDGSFFASIAEGNAISCVKDNIKLRCNVRVGSKDQVNYEDKNSLKDKVSFGYVEESDTYDSLIEEDEAKTVYFKVECTFNDYLRAGENVILVLDDKVAGTYTIIGDETKGFQIKTADGQYVGFKDGKVVIGKTAYTWKYKSGLYIESKVSYIHKVKGKKVGFITTVRNYLTLDDEGNLTTTTSPVDAEVQVTTDRHKLDYNCISETEHEILCYQCDENLGKEEHTYNEISHLCYCGKFDPSECYIKAVKATKTSYIGFEKVGKKTKVVTKYLYAFAPEVNNVLVDKVEYSLNGIDDFKSGLTFTSNIELDEFYVRVTDSKGVVTLWKYTGDIDLELVE